MSSTLIRISLETILPAYDDPLFSIMLIVVIFLMIAILTYGWGLRKHQKEEGNLLKFLEKFDTVECALDTEEMAFEASMTKPLTLLAKAFENAGEYPKAISIYVYLIKHIPSDSDRLELMERLGSTYLHAGFLLRSQHIYTEILRKKPHNTKVLYALGIVYEMMQEYDKARETLVPLKTLGENIASLEKFVDFSELLHNKTLNPQIKIAKLQAILQKEPALYRHIIAALLQLDTKSAWKTMDPLRTQELLDILWYLPLSQLDLDIIASDQQLKTLYYAKGYLQEAVVESGIFSVDMLASAKQNGFSEGDLHFSYLCQKCKQHFPISFKRCPSCMALYSLKVEESIAKSSPKTDYSLF